MRLLPRSLFGRLLALSLVATLCAVAVAGVAISGVLERFVTSTIDARLGDRLIALEAAVKPDGDIEPALAARAAARITPDEPWRIDTPQGSTGTRDANGGLVLSIDGPLPDGPRLPGPPGPRRHGPRDALPEGARPFEARLPDGTAIHGLTLDVQLTGGIATIDAAVPRATIDRPIRAALVPLALSLLALGLALAVAAVVQLRIGLRPLDRLRRSLAAVRAGDAATVPDDQPHELAPLARELNALIATNASQLANARRHAANLAHGLKTPLAALALQLREGGRDPDGTLAAQVARIDRTVRHHLTRARGDATGATRGRTPVAETVDGLLLALERIHADRPLAATNRVPLELTVAIDRQDLDELLGNLLDNAWRFARAAITVDATAEGATVHIAIADDGPGIAADQRETATQPGRRLDEAAAGHGFGLAIARELAELHGGTLRLEETPGGGLTVTVELPR